MSELIKPIQRYKRAVLHLALYMAIQFVVDFARHASDMTQARWDAMWWMERAGWWAGCLSGTVLIAKAFLSNGNQPDARLETDSELK